MGRSGAAESMGKAALVQAVGVPQSALRAPHMTAMQDSQTGCRAGVSPKRIGAATTQAKVAHQQLEGAPEQGEQFPGLGKLGQVLSVGVCAPSSDASEFALPAMRSLLR